MSERSTGLWRNRNFLKLWTAKTVSDFGSMISGTALSFTAILTLRATPSQLGLLVVANLLPKCIAGPFAGVWVDRLRRRPLMIAADLARALLLCTIPAAALLGLLRIGQIYAVTFLTGMLTLLFDIADRSYLPSVIDPDRLVDGNSTLTATSSVAEFGAFSLAGWLVQWLTAPIAILADSVSFLFSAFFLGLIRVREPAPLPHSERRGMTLEIGEGIQAVRRDPLLSTLTIAALLLGLSGGILGAVIVAFMVRDLGFRPGTLGMIWAVGGLASFFGAVAAGKIARRIGTGPAMILGLFSSGLGVLFVSVARGPTLLAGELLVVAQCTDAGHTIYEIHQVSLRQSLVADRFQGRVSSLMEATGLGATIVGALAGGYLGGHIGLRYSTVIGGMGTLCAALWLGISPVRGVMDGEAVRIL